MFLQVFITEDRLLQELFDFIPKPTVIALDLSIWCFRVVIKESLYSQANICRLEFDCAGCTESLKVSQVSQKCLTSVSQVSHKCLKVLESKQNCYLH